MAEWTFALDHSGFFDLLGFEDIALEWEKLQDLNEDAQEILEDDENYFGHCDKEINAFGYYARPEWIPIATDHQGNYLLIDLAPTNSGKKGQIIELSNETWDRHVVADSLYDLITKKINQLNSTL